MSSTLPDPVTERRDQLVAGAQSLAQLISAARQVDPVFATSLIGKSLASSRSPLAVLATGVVSWLIAHFGLSWSSGFADLAGSGGVLLGGYVMRYFTTQRIDSLLNPALLLMLVSLASLTACAPAPALAAGPAFCVVHGAGADQTVALVDAMTALPDGAALSVMRTASNAAYIADQCKFAGLLLGGEGAPVAAPASTAGVQQVPVLPPLNPRPGHAA